jgi:hypothetical protein
LRKTPLIPLYEGGDICEGGDRKVLLSESFVKTPTSLIKTPLIPSLCAFLEKALGGDYIFSSCANTICGVLLKCAPACFIVTKSPDF